MSLGDKKIYLQPGQKSLPVRAAGDFIFLKEAPFPVRVLVAGQPTLMHPGSKIRVPRDTPGQMGFESFEVDNPSNELAVSVTFVVGVGDYDQQIISGGVTSETILRGAHGRVSADTRQKREIALFPGKITTEEYESGQEVAAAGGVPLDVNSTHVISAPNDRISVIKSAGSSAWEERLYNTDLEYVGKSLNIGRYSDSSPIVNYQQFAYCPGRGLAGFTGNSVSLPVDMRRRVALVHGAVGSRDLFTFPHWSTGGSFCFVDSDVVAYNYGSGSIRQIRFARFGEGFQLIASVDLPGAFSASGTVSYDEKFRKVWYRQHGANRVCSINVDTLEVDYVGNPAGWPGYTLPGAVAVRGEFAYSITNSGAASTSGVLRKYTTKDLVIRPSFRGVDRGTASELNAYLNKRPLATSVASFEIFETPNGLQVSGQLVRLALESYYGRSVGEGYMDHVYSVRFGSDGAGLPTINEGGGNSSLSLLGVQDNFTAVMPSVVTVEHDSELELGGYL